MWDRGWQPDAWRSPRPAPGRGWGRGAGRRRHARLRARSWHTAGTRLCSGAPQLAAALLPDKRKAEVYAQPRATCAGFPGKLSPWRSIARICPRLLPPGTAEFRGFGTGFCRRGWEELPARGSGELGTFRRTMAQPSTRPLLSSPAALGAG